MGREVFKNNTKMKILTKCEICNNTRFTHLFIGRDKLLGLQGEFDLVKCNCCGVEFLNPQPNHQELKKYYDSNKYYSLKKISNDSFKTKFKIFLYKLYFTKNNNYMYKLLFSPIKFMIRTTILKKGLKILDIGSGTGQFLYEMKQCGLNVYGVEPGDFDESENLNIKNTTLLNAKYPSNFFDIITMNHVLEHLDNPNETIKEIYRILKNNGIFIIGVPNTRSLANKLFNKNWLAYDVPRHLFNYSDKLIVDILKQHNFKIKEVRYNSRPSQFVMSLYFLLGIKKRDGFINNILELLFTPLTLLVNSIKFGDQVEILCKKNKMLSPNSD